MFLIFYFQSREYEQIFIIIGGLVYSFILIYIGYEIVMNIVPYNRKINLYKSLIISESLTNIYKIISQESDEYYDRIRFKCYIVENEGNTYRIFVDEDEELIVDKVYKLTLRHHILLKGESYEEKQS